ncbi:hypothetical protein RFI_38790 [Reticulomyxa filosa]|uniref:Uncharacterized protein n=1 Tax=Reticulomyxa filosa TaxID=46433 RepID=X6LC32_RETFI|nr:hypothetical protein RFI_38790 [Reticulomyxa filosa]|eukprot:ETN98701.1 hypothetical protein RFI_38790 [Reticulomyxa filosa]
MVGGDFASIRDVATACGGVIPSSGTGGSSGASGGVSGSGDSFGDDDDDVGDVLLLDSAEEHFDVQQVRIAFLQFFVRICRNYRAFVEYTETKNLTMRFRSQDFLASFPENERVYPLFAHDFYSNKAFFETLHCYFFLIKKKKKLIIIMIGFRCRFAEN